MLKNLKKENGFTLIEMIVSLGIFSIIITTAVGALLVLLSSNQRLQTDQGIMSTLSFAVDSMTRELRTGYNYFCEGYADYDAGSDLNFMNDNNDHEAGDGGLDIIATTDCPNGRPSNFALQGVSFVEGGDSITGGYNRIAYYFDKTRQTIMRRVGNDASQSIISSDIEIVNAEFFVTGSASLDSSNNTEQPTITIYIEAKKVGEPKVYYLQTTVTQRTLDL
ncbi:MAG: type II secretion system protein [Candidatus Paceibacterota bacterium]